MSSEDHTVLGGSSDSDDSNELKPGMMLDNYRIVRLLGRGGMGAVYLAEHTALEKRYAVKVLPEGLGRSGSSAERFREEARRMADLEHAGIVPIYYSGESGGLRYFAMEYLPGGDLEHALSAGRLSPPVVHNYLRHLLEALMYAHGQGVVHRDLKPANLLLTEDGRLKVADFGLAQVVGEDYMKSLVQQTVAASVLGDAKTLISGSGSASPNYAGTIHYMAPEVIAGESATLQSDLYAVGVIAYYLLTGRRPIGKYRDASQLVEGLDPAWDRWLDDLMAPEPEYRTKSAEEALAALPSPQAAAVAPPSASPSTPAKSTEPVAPSGPSSSKKYGWLAVFGLILGALGVAAWSMYERWDRIEPPEPIRGTGGLIVRSDPSGATVSIEGEAAQLTPAVFADLNSGRRGLVLELDGYDRLEQRVEVKTGEFLELPVFPLRRSRGTLLVETLPSNAHVELRGPEGSQGEGSSPQAFSNLPTGDYQIEVSRPPLFRQMRQQVAVEADATTRMSLELKGQDYQLSLPDDQVLDMIWLDAGRFTMGSPSDEPGRDSDEGPQTEVELSRGFWLGKYPVTVGQWKAVMGTDLRDQVRKALEDNTLFNIGGERQTFRDIVGLERDSDPARLLGNEDDALPMHYVSWEDAVEFCRRLTERERTAGRLPEGYAYSLPSEAQWEYAARAGTDTATYGGSIEILGRYNAPVLDAIAWYGGNSSVGYEGRGWNTDNWEDKQYPGGTAGPRNVGEKNPNAWGLHDTLGNVFEWTRTWYGRYPGGRVVDYEGPDSGTNRVYRGGSWDNSAAFTRSAIRFGYSPGFRYCGLGFRLALSSVQ